MTIKHLIVRSEQFNKTRKMEMLGYIIQVTSLVGWVVGTILVLVFSNK